MTTASYKLTQSYTGDIEITIQCDDKQFADKIIDLVEEYNDEVTGE